MAKRFTDTDIFKKQFIRDLKGPYKLLWFYILADCNHCGIWECDFEVAQLRIGEKVKKSDAEKFFGTKIIPLDGGAKWFLPSFIEFQYGELKENNRAHSAVISMLSKYDLLDSENQIKGLASPLQGRKDMDMDKEKDKDKDKDKEKEGGKKNKTELIYPFDSEEFLKVWGVLVKEPKWKNKSPAALQESLRKLSEQTETDAIQMMKNSIAGGWQGLFELKQNNQDGNGKNKSTGRKTGYDLDEIDNAADRILQEYQRKINSAGDTDRSPDIGNAA